MCVGVHEFRPGGGGPVKGNLFALLIHLLSKNYDPHRTFTTTLTGQVSRLLTEDIPFMSSSYKTFRTLTGSTKLYGYDLLNANAKTFCHHPIGGRIRHYGVLHRQKWENTTTFSL